LLLLEVAAVAVVVVEMPPVIVGATGVKHTPRMRWLPFGGSESPKSCSTRHNSPKQQQKQQQQQQAAATAAVAAVAAVATAVAAVAVESIVHIVCHVNYTPSPL
jgi:hypothetical protein